MAKSEDATMRNILGAAIAALAVLCGNLAAASAAPLVGDGTTLDKQSTILTYSTAGG